MKKIFIIHGWTYTTDKWKEVVSLISAAGFEPVQLAVPGLTEASNKIWTLDDYIGWLYRQLENETDPIVVGHSNGGRIAIAFAARYPKKLGKLILVDSAGIYHNELPLRLKRFLFGTAAKFGKKITSSETARKILYKAAGEGDYKNADPLMKKTMANLISVDLTANLSRIECPTLIIWGKKDRATPLADGQIMNSAIKNSEIMVVDGAAHSPHFTHAKQVTERILQFIKS